MSKKSALFRSFTQRRKVVYYRRFKRSYRSQFKGHKQSTQHLNCFWPLKLGPIGCPETSLRTYLSTLCKTSKVNVKVKCTLVQALRLCTGRSAHRGCGGIALLFHDRCTRRGWGVSVTPRPLFTPGKDPVPIVQGYRVPLYTGTRAGLGRCGKSRPHRDSIPGPSIP